MFLLYSFLYSIAISILFLPQYFKRSPRLRSRWLREKFGYLPVAGPSIWVHAVSVGEVGASIGLIMRLRDEYPDMSIVLSTITDTGQEVAAERVPEGTMVVYLPFDIGFILRKSLKKVRPKAFIVIETELWPNIFRIMAGNSIPVIVMNGRISEKSFRGYRNISFFMKRVFQHVRIFGMQSSIDAERLNAIGCDREKIKVTGNFKFDLDIPRDTPEWTRDVHGPVIVAGSTFKGEEEIILSACSEIVKSYPSLKLVLAPRHPERFAEVEELLRSSQVRYAKRSGFGSQPTGMSGPSYDVVLLDTVGELAAVYGAADIAIIGKSFKGFGGQNPLEPAFWGKPVICGPHMENFPFIEEFYREGAAFQVSPSDLGKTIDVLLSDRAKREAAGGKARELVMKHSGAVERAVEIIREHINR
jgi:3-deoxy-D-manno-octulosonic-acid transferase